MNRLPKFTIASVIAILLAALHGAHSNELTPTVGAKDRNGNLII